MDHYEELRQLDIHLKALIDTITREAAEHGINPHELRTPDGNLLMAPLVVARVQVVIALKDSPRSTDNDDKE